MNGAHDVDLGRIDLNLLVAFEALARERNVTRAAGRLGVTQSAMSHTLRRLRELLGDALLVRGRTGMVLTPRAESLVVPLRGALVAISRALTEPGVFTPATARRAFALASPDLFDVLVVPALLERVRREAPDVDLTIGPTDPRRLADQLESGELDVAIVARVDPTTKDARAEATEAGGLVQRSLIRDRFACFVRAGHPALRGKRPRLDLDDFASLSHLLVSPSGAGPGLVDEALAQRGLSRRIALRVPHFYAACAIVARSDLVLTAPAVLADIAPAGPRVVAVPPPLPLPEHAVLMTWHERFTGDPGHTWLRGVLAEIARELRPSRGRARMG